MITIRNLLLITIIGIFSFGQADTFAEFTRRINSDWHGFILKELPNIGVYDPADEERCLERLAEKHITAELLLHRKINIKENLKAIEASGEEASLAHLLQHYQGRYTLMARDQGDFITFFTAVPGGGVLNWTYCFFRKDK